jgi:hypothetical protein
MKMEPTSARFTLRLCALSAALSLVAGAAMAQTDQKPPREKDDGKAAAGAPVAARAVAAPNARLAALIKSGGGIVRNKGVQSVTRIAKGVYCIRPQSSTGINPANAIVTVAVEYYYSRLNEVQVQWAVQGSGCGSNRIAVYTLSDLNANGIYSFSNDVGFSIVVP